MELQARQETGIEYCEQMGIPVPTVHYEPPKKYRNIPEIIDPKYEVTPEYLEKLRLYLSDKTNALNMRK